MKCSASNGGCDAKRALRRAGYFCSVAREESGGDCAELEAAAAGEAVDIDTFETAEQRDGLLNSSVVNASR